jgi:TnpA family transposase
MASVSADDSYHVSSHPLPLNLNIIKASVGNHNYEYFQEAVSKLDDGRSMTDAFQRNS